MKYRFSFIVVLATLLTTFLTSCKEEIDLLAGKKESAVVYGILDINETAHYIKVTRTFIGDGNSSALDIAAIADSSYFDQVDIQIKEILSNGSTGRTFTLHDTIIQNKSTEGVFYAPDQKVYVFYTTANQPLLANATYKMTINIDNGRILVTGETKLVSGLTPGTFSNSNNQLKLTASGAELGLYTNLALTMSSTGSSYKLNGKMDFVYSDFTSAADSTVHEVSFGLGEFDVNNNSLHTFNINGENLYRGLKEKIPVSNTIVRRKLEGVRITVTGASRELANYMEVNKPSSTLAQNKPKYTNLTISEGHNVIGIFASRYSYVLYKQAVASSAYIAALDKKSRRELCSGPLTGSLGFCSNHVTDATETWSCN